MNLLPFRHLEQGIVFSLHTIRNICNVSATTFPNRYQNLMLIQRFSDSYHKTEKLHALGNPLGPNIATCIMAPEQCSCVYCAPMSQQ